jgi:hypothetical protein
MKNILFLFSLLLVVGCDNIPLEDIEQTIIQPPDTRQKRTRKVLLEYFTGHTCGNCPSSGGEAVTQLSNLYPQQLVVMSIHAGFFARPRPAGQPFDYDFRTQAGNSLDEQFGVTSAGTPKGLVNRTSFNGNLILNPSAWSGSVASFFADSALIGISLNRSFSAETRTATVEANFSAFDNINFPVRVQAFITEDSIVNWQRDYNKTPEDAPDYVHRFVLRGNMVSSAGDQLISATQTTQANFRSMQFQAVIPAGWNVKTLRAVVVVYRQSDGQVLQAEKIRLNT